MEEGQTGLLLFIFRIDHPAVRTICFCGLVSAGLSDPEGSRSRLVPDWIMTHPYQSRADGFFILNLVNMR